MELTRSKLLTKGFFKKSLKKWKRSGKVEQQKGPGFGNEAFSPCASPVTCRISELSFHCSLEIWHIALCLGPSNKIWKKRKNALGCADHQIFCWLISRRPVPWPHYLFYRFLRCDVYVRLKIWASTSSFFFSFLTHSSFTLADFFVHT